MSLLRVQFHKPGLVHANGLAPVAGVPASGGGTLGVSGTPTAGGSQLTVPASGPWAIKLQAIGADCYYAIGSSPDPTAEPRGWLASGEVEWVFAAEGEKIACVAASLEEGTTA